MTKSFYLLLLLLLYLFTSLSAAQEALKANLLKIELLTLLLFQNLQIMNLLIWTYDQEYTTCHHLAIVSCFYCKGKNQFSVIYDQHSKSNAFHLFPLRSPVDWGCWIHRLHLIRVKTHHNEYPVYEIKHSDRETTDLWGKRCIPSLPSLPGPLWPGVAAPDRLLSMGQKELFDILTECIQMTC